MTPPFSLLPRLSHPLSLHIHLSFAHLSLLPQLYACSHFIATLFSFLLFAFSKREKQPERIYLSLLAPLPPSGMSFHLSRVCFSLLHLSVRFSSPTHLPYRFFLDSFRFVITDASLGGRVCSEYLKPHLPSTLWPSCPSCSMWRSQTLELRFWVPLMSSACWDTTVMYPYWLKVSWQKNVNVALLITD